MSVAQSRARTGPAGQEKCSCSTTKRTSAPCTKCGKAEAYSHGDKHSPAASSGSLSHTVGLGLSSHGRSLDPTSRAFFEPRFGQQFGDVRIHTDDSAAESVRAQDAAAYAVGPHIAFGAGKYTPGSDSGRALLAHELAHVVQQRGARSSGALSLTRPGDRAEREAGAAARAVLQGQPPPELSPTPRMVARGFGDDMKVPPLRSSGLTEAEWDKIRAARKFFNLPDRPTTSQSTIVGVIVPKDGKDLYVKSGEDGGPYGGTQRGSIPRGKGEAFTGGGPSQGNIATHVEGHTTAIMHQRGITEATLLIEEAPCKMCDNPRGTPNISKTLPPGAKLTIVDPETTGHYKSLQLPPVAPKPAPGAAAEGGSGLGASKNTLPAAPKTAPLEKVLPTKPQVPQLPKSGATPELTARPPVTGAGGGAKMGPRVLRGAGNIAFNIAVLTATVVWELVVVPRIKKLQTELDKLVFELEEDRRKRLEAKIQEKFEVYEAKHIGRIVKSCYLGKLRQLESAGKKGYVNVTVSVSFEDTSGRFQLFEETPPESYYDLEFYDIDLVDATVSETATDATTGKLERCDSCGPMNRGKSYIGNNPIWSQRVTFSFEAPKSTEIAKEFEVEPDLGKCLSDVACFIATACYGSLLAPQLDWLRGFRDRMLLTHATGRAFVRFYYFASPPFARWLRGNSAARCLVRYVLIAPCAHAVHALGLDGSRDHSARDTHRLESSLPSSVGIAMSYMSQRHDFIASHAIGSMNLHDDAEWNIQSASFDNAKRRVACKRTRDAQRHDRSEMS